MNWSVHFFSTKTFHFPFCTVQQSSIWLTRLPSPKPEWADEFEAMDSGYNYALWLLEVEMLPAIMVDMRSALQPKTNSMRLKPPPKKQVHFHLYLGHLLATLWNPGSVVVGWFLFWTRLSAPRLLTAMGECERSGFFPPWHVAPLHLSLGTWEFSRVTVDGAKKCIGTGTGFPKC